MSTVFNFTFVPLFRSVAPYIHKFRNQTFVVGVCGEAIAAGKLQYLAQDLASDTPLILADRDRLIQVMLNLLSNAVKFCASNDGKVHVTLRREGAALRVDVLDNGPGISSANQGLIFERFRQVGNTMTDKPQGTGLGLPISRHIIERFGGRLWVQSKPGQGATFSFTLPLQQANASAAGTPL